MAPRKIFCNGCGQPYELLWNGRERQEWGCRTCRADRAKQWRSETGYDYNAYYVANKDRINGRRRKRRNDAKKKQKDAEFSE
jgi:hypothetical protein